MDNSEVYLAPSGGCDYLIPADELSSLSEVIGSIQTRARREHSLYVQAVGGTFERLARELSTTAMEGTVAQLHQLSMQMMAALTEFKHEACELLGEILARELGCERRQHSELLLSKILSTVDQLVWPHRISLFVNPDQLKFVESELHNKERFCIAADPGIDRGNFRLELGQTSMTYDLMKEARRIAAEFRERLSQDVSN